MPAPYPPVPFQLETALLIQLRDALRWESSIAPVNAAGTYSGTLTVPDANAVFKARDYQTRDRELAWLDTRNAAAVVEVSLEVADVWNAPVLRPTTEGAQIGQIDFAPQDVSADGMCSRVIHVKNASVPIDALQVDRDLAGRDIVVYETLVKAVQNLFTSPPIVTSGGTISQITAWSYAQGTAAQQDISPNLPLNRDLFKVPDMNLADRDNQMAGYVAQLCQVLKNPFAYADRLYVAVSGVDSREVETYTLIAQPFEAGTVYLEGDEIVHEGIVYRVIQGIGSTSDAPWANPWVWEVVSQARKRVWTAEPALSGRNRFVYDTESQTIQWFRETASVQHVPQLVALSVPGIFSGQTLQVLARVPERKDGQFWRNKAAHVVPEGATLVDVYSLPSVACSFQQGFLIQTEAASLTIPGQGTVSFPDPVTKVVEVISAGSYRVAALVEPNSTVEMAGGENNQGVTGLVGGATFSSFGQFTYSIGLPPTAWTVEFDYTNLSGSASGFRIKAQLGNTLVFDDTAPFYFNDTNGDALANGTVVTSVAFPISPTGGLQVFSLNWTGGTGELHIRAIRFKSTAYATGHYRISGTLAGKVSTVDVIGEDKVPGVMTWDFVVPSTLPNLALTYERDAQLPLRFLRMDLAEEMINVPTPNAQGFQSYRQDCLVRAVRSAQQAFTEAYYAGTAAPIFLSSGSWDGDATDRWMALMETAEPRLRQLDDIPGDGIVAGRQYCVASGTLVYEGGTYAAGQSFWSGTATTYVWSVAGQLNQVGAWMQSKATYNGRPALAPRGVYFDYTAGTLAVAYAPEQTTPELVTIQPWMIEVGFYAAQPEFWLPTNV